MNDKMTDGEIFDTLSAIIAEALRVDRTKVRPDARIFHDLGAESLDLLDIRFRIEESFGFKIEQDEITRALGEGATAAQIGQKLTVRSLVDFIKTRLRSRVNIT